MRLARVPSPAAVSGYLWGALAAQTDTAPLWAPVAFGLGAAGYLGLKTEPAIEVALAPALVLSAAAVVCWRFSRRRGLIALSGLVALIGCGFLVAKLHSDRVATPIAPAGLGMVRIDGWVVDVATPSPRGERVLIAPVHIARLSPAETPGRVRIVLGAGGGVDDVPPPGSSIRVDALLDPPPGPASPGAYDFARDAWFEGIGGVGLAMKTPQFTGLELPPWRVRWEMAVNGVRWRVAQTLARDIGSVLGPDDGGAAGLAAAVTTSHQDWLATDHRDDLRASGLAHMLAIAGLHTAAISGFAFYAFRLGIAGWPWLALRVPGKKVAAVAALIVVAGYLTLSGAHPPARRAAITASVALFAILVDRRAVSLRSLSVAALIILLIEPEVVVQPGFEMSFCATASLIALAELWRRPARPVGLAWPLAALQSLRDWILAMAAVSFVAGMATGPFAIQHFNRVANYGVFANLTADLLASVVMMPALAVSLLAQFTGLSHVLGAPALWVAGWAARGINAIGHLFATVPGAAMTIPSAPQIALALSYVGIVFACLWRGRMRWVGVPLAAAVAVWPRPPAPVAWIAADGNDAAIVVRGQEVALKPDKRQYATQLWAQRRGFTLPANAATAQKAAFDCDRKGCVSLGSSHPALSAWWSKRIPGSERFDALCEGADIVILRTTAAPPATCRGAIVLNPASFENGGAAEVFAASGPGGGWRIAWSQPIRGRRPWSFSDSGG